MSAAPASMSVVRVSTWAAPASGSVAQGLLSVAQGLLSEGQELLSEGQESLSEGQESLSAQGSRSEVPVLPWAARVLP